ncbi:MAG: hypothetical protein ACT6Q8_19385 [Niveispirillum sp.]|uniref:hypothetical protein n=1 Tax=Niveispirillum sp. TaxID=1917217 RepID=UPI004036FAB6
MRHLSLICLILVLTACAQTPAPPAPPTQPTSIDNGLGSQFGNYENYETGSTHQSPSGPCPIYAWDRPISGGRVIRYLSAACPAPQPGRPDAVSVIDMGRQVVTP